MKTIKYNICTIVNHGTEEEPNIAQVNLPMEMKCKTLSDFDANYPIAEKEAIPGTIEVSGEFDPEPEVPTDTERIDELEEALNMILIGVTE